MPIKKTKNRILQGILFAFIWSSLVACGKNETILITKEEPQSQIDISVEESDKSADEIDQRAETSKQSLDESKQKEEEKEQLCYVHISGAINHPGVISLKKGARVFEAIELAGGFLTTADEDYVNQALEITDGLQIYIPTVEEVEQGNVAGNQSDAIAFGKDKEGALAKISLNTATVEELCTLSGIGESRAKAILQYREEKGAFSTIEEIKNIAGIKEGLYNKIKDKIEVK